MYHKCRSLFYLPLAIFVLARLGLGDQISQPPLHVLLLGGEKEKALWAGLEKGGLFEVRRTAWPPADGGLLSWADCLALELAGGAGLKEDQAAALLEKVRAGKGLVAQLGLAPADPLPEAASALLGLKRVKPHPGPPVACTVLVPDQSTPVTQCLPHFRHRGAPGDWEPAPEAAVLASAVPDESEAAGLPLPPPAAPVLWTVRPGKGLVVVSALEGSGPSAALVQTILARAAQWAGGRAVTVTVQGEFKLLAEALVEKDAGGGSPFLAASGFYRGRQVAPTMSYRGADWLVRPEREGTEQPEKVLDSLAIAPGSTVVDLGAGVGYFTFRLARRVGPQGKVLAVDVQEEMLRLLKERAGKEELKNIELVRADDKDPHLPESAVDLVLMVDVYHELADPPPVMEGVKKALKENGRLVLVEYRGEDPRVPIKPLHRTLERQVRAELEALGFRWQETKDFLPHQHILIFTKK